MPTIQNISSPSARVRFGQQPTMERVYRPDGLVDVAKRVPKAQLDVRYATADNFIKRPVYDVAKVFLAKEPTEALKRASNRLSQLGLGLILYDGYRPFTVVQTFWDETPPALRHFVTDPKIGGRHSRGYAVDLSLYDLKTGKPLPMPSGYDEFTERAYPGYTGGSLEARQNRDLLKQIMESEGFKVYPYEWWHFDYPGWETKPIIETSLKAIENRNQPWLKRVVQTFRMKSGIESSGEIKG